MTVSIKKKVFATSITAGTTIDEPTPSIQLSLADKKDEALSIKEHPIKSHTTVLNKKTGTNKEDTSVVGVVMSTVPMCNVGVQASKTINLGDYNNVKLGVSINIPCAYEEIDVTYVAAKHFVEEKMEDLLSEENPKI